MSTESDRAGTSRLDTEDPETATTRGEQSPDSKGSAAEPNSGPQGEKDRVFVAGDSVADSSSEATSGEGKDADGEHVTAHESGSARKRVDSAVGGSSETASGEDEKADGHRATAHGSSHATDPDAGSDAPKASGTTTNTGGPAHSPADTDDPSGASSKPEPHGGPAGTGVESTATAEPGGGATAGGGSPESVEKDAVPSATARTEAGPDERPTAASDPVGTDGTGSADLPAAGTKAPEPTADATPADPHTELIPALRQPVEEVSTLPLFDEPTLDLLRNRWRDLQGSFIDSPRDAVTRADDLVAELIHQLTAAYAERKAALVEGWSAEPDTEALRQALRGYRAFFNQLLSPTS